MRNTLRSLALGGVCLAGSPGPALAQNLLPETVSHYEEIRMFRKFVGDTFDEHDVDKLEVCLATIRETEERFRSGAWLAPQFYRGLAVGGRVRCADQNDYLAALGRWRRAKPDSTLPLIAMADAYRGYAWDARGTGYAHTVSDSGWTDFETYIDLAWDALQEALEVDDADPELYRMLVRVGRSNGIDKATLLAYCAKGAELEPTYAPIYESMAFALLTKWLGDSGEVERFAKDSADRLKGEDADELYVRIAWSVYDDSPTSFFERYDFDWERMKRGFEAIERRNPGSRFNRNSFCHMATRARDREVAKRYFSDVEGEWNDDRREIWGSERSFDAYRAWATGDGEFPGPGELHTAVRDGDSAKVGELLADGADVNARGEGGITPLIQALEGAEVGIAMLLIEGGADPELTTDKGWSPISSAAHHGQPHVVGILISLGCSPNTTDIADWTPLHLAARKGFDDVVEVLLERPETVVDLRDDRNKTPLHHAANGGHVTVAEQLLGHPDIEVDARDKWEWTPLHYAARLGRLDVARRLLEAEADVNARNKKGHTPLKEALRRDQSEMAEVLREHGGAE